MKLTSIAVGSLAIVGLAACVTIVEPEPIVISTQYDAAAQFVRAGTNSISGNAVLRTVGGDAKTCAGFPVKLVNVNSYSTARFTAIYGSVESGYLPARSARRITPDNSHWDNEAGRTETCDSQGNFAFQGVADGDYYVVTAVMWGVPQSAYVTSQQGGALFRKVTVSGGETKRIVLTEY